MEIDRGRFLADLEALTLFGASACGGIDRTALSSADVAARHWLADQLRSCGYDTVIDGVGNVYGQPPAVDYAVLVGSHLDSVPNGGRLDGALGVAAALAIARAAMKASPRKTGIDVIAFSDEEGRFGDLLGSRVHVGDFAQTDAVRLTDSNGLSLASALREAGLLECPIARLDPTRTTAFVELHIEQGPVLAAAEVSIGVVSAVAGIARWDVEFTGRADHAGTTPMGLRRDAGAAMVSFLHNLGEHLGEPVVWTCGSMQVKPGAPNVVPGYAACTVEVRSVESEVLERAGAILQQRARCVAATRIVEVSCSLRSKVAPVAFDSGIRSVLSAAASALRLRAIAMPSGAGHDAMVLAPHVPSGMVFVPSIEGRSHSPAETTDPEDIFRGVQVLAEAVDMLTSATGYAT